MPDFATHHIFGENLEKSSAADKYPEIYRWGLQGPDILFFRKIRIKASRYHVLGKKMHEEKTAELFSAMVSFCKESNGEVKEQAQAYLQGFAAHYALDRFLHPYVQYHQDKLVLTKKHIHKGVAHCQIESDIDTDLYLYIHHKQVCKFYHEEDYLLPPTQLQTISALYTFVLYDVYRELISPVEIINAINNAKKIQKRLYCGRSSMVTFGKLVDTAIGMPGVILSHIKGNRPDWDSMNLGKDPWVNINTGKIEHTSVPQIMDHAAEYFINLHCILERNCRGAILPMPLEMDFSGKPIKIRHS